MKNLFETRKVRFNGISPSPDKANPAYRNAYCDYICGLVYIISDENGFAKERFYKKEVIGNEYYGPTEAKRKITSKIFNLIELFGEEKEGSKCGGEARFLDLICTGIFYKDDIIAITNDEGKECLDALLNEIKPIEVFEKEFIEKRIKHLEEEREKCDKRLEEIYDELLCIL